MALHGVRADIRVQLDLHGQVYCLFAQVLLQCRFELGVVAAHRKTQGNRGHVGVCAGADLAHRCGAAESFFEIGVYIPLKGGPQACKIRIVGHVRGLAGGGREYGIILARSLCM